MNVSPYQYRALLFFIFSFVTIQTTKAQLTVSNLFSSGAILQQEVEVPIWGKATVNDSVFVSIENHIDTVVTDANGKWEAAVPTHSAGGPYTLSVETKTQNFTFNDIYFGDVWLAAGQSNMEWTLTQSDGGAAEISAANDDLLRECKILKGLSAELSDELPTSYWNASSSNQIGNFSAVAYYFAKELRSELNIPVGIVNNTYGGSRIEAWMSEDILGYDETQVALQGGTYEERQPTMIYNKMMNPILRFPFKGIIWYQGESNSDHLEDAKAYGEQFKTMINAWRTAMGQGDIPFIWVQLPNNGPLSDENTPATWDAWPQIRAGQSRALELPQTGEVTAIDLGETDIHPTNKKPVGERLALVARKLVYGEDIAYSGPRYASHSIDNDTIIIDFNHIEGGLKGDANDSLRWFSIAGSNGTLYPAKAVIQGNQVKVWSPNVSSPTILRYAWDLHPEGVNFYNSADLPAAPFYIYLDKTTFTVDENLADATIERGNRVDFEWQAFHTSSITINNEEVETISGTTFYPMTTTTYTLTAVNETNASDTYTKTVTITVIDPQPTIALSTDQSNFVNPNTTVTITADAEAPGGGSVTQVEFFIDGQSLSIDNTAPYAVEWTPTLMETYELTAVVTDGNNNTTTSSIYEVLVTNLDVLTLEAEDGTITGDGSIKTLVAASNGAYVDVQDDWTVEFASFNSTKAGTYKLTIRYLLNYEGPKGQNLTVNGVSQGEVTFTAPNSTDWQTTSIDIPVQVGTNTISFSKSWGWMSFDYVTLAAEPGVFTTITGLNDTKGTIQVSAFPNPAHTFYILDLSQVQLNQSPQVTIYNAAGEQVKPEYSFSKNQSLRIDTSRFTEGMYTIKIKTTNEVIIKKFIIQH